MVELDGLDIVLGADELRLLIFLHARDIRMTQHELAEPQIVLARIADGAKLHLADTLHGGFEVGGERR